MLFRYVGRCGELVEVQNDHGGVYRFSRKKQWNPVLTIAIVCFFKIPISDSEGTWSEKTLEKNWIEKNYCIPLSDFLEFILAPILAKKHLSYTRCAKTCLKQHEILNISYDSAHRGLDRILRCPPRLWCFLNPKLMYWNTEEQWVDPLARSSCSILIARTLTKSKNPRKSEQSRKFRLSEAAPSCHLQTQGGAADAATVLLFTPVQLLLFFSQVLETEF